jgi:mRNA-degrading endonuclease toxin of MazEF toxin-antitoxin module
MAFAQGSVVLAPASFKGGRRPYLVVSNEERPFFGDEYTVAVITTKERDRAVELTADSFVEGRLDRYPSYVNPWSLHVFQHEDIDRRVGSLGDAAMASVVDGICEFVRSD